MHGLRGRFCLPRGGARLGTLLRLATSPGAVRPTRHHHILVLLDAVRGDELVTFGGLLLLSRCPGKKIAANLDVIVGCGRNENVSVAQLLCSR